MSQSIQSRKHDLDELIREQLSESDGSAAFGLQDDGDVTMSVESRLSEGVRRPSMQDTSGTDEGMEMLMMGPAPKPEAIITATNPMMDEKNGGASECDPVDEIIDEAFNSRRVRSGRSPESKREGPLALFSASQIPAVGEGESELPSNLLGLLIFLGVVKKSPSRCTQFHS